MPDLSANLTALRSTPSSIRLWLAIFGGTEVYSATVDSVDDNYTVSTLTISGGSGTFSDVKRGADVRVFNSGGEYKGRVRVRRAGTLSTSSIPISETAQGFVDIIAGDTISILDDHRLRPVFPEASSDFDPDKEAYTNQTDQFRPVAHSGGHVAAWVDTGQSYATLNFYGASSYTLDDESGGTVTHSWTFPSGSTPASSTSDAPTGVQIPVGQHRIEHTVTDSSNSQTWTQYVWCGVYNLANPPYDVDIDTLQLSGTENDGWELSFDLLESVDTDTLPDGTWVVLFSEEIINGSVQSFGNRNSGRSPIKFVGILRTDDSNYVGESGLHSLSFTAVSPLAVLREMAGFSQFFENGGTSASSWQTLEQMSIKRTLIHLLRTYTTLTDVCDLYFEADDYDYPRLSFQQATPFDAINELLGGIDSRLTCDRTCNVMVQTYPEFYAIADRTSLTTTLTLAERDYFDLHVTRSHHEPVRLLEGRAFFSTGISLSDIYARWPSLTPGEGYQDTQIEWMVATSQADLNTRTGHKGAKLNRVFVETDGRKQIAPSITLTVPYDVFDFYQEWVAFTVDATSNWREIDLSSFRWIIRQTSVDYTGGVCNVQLTLDAETAGRPAQTYIPPQIDPDQLPPFEIEPIDWIPPFIGPFPTLTWGQGTGDVAAVKQNGTIDVTSNFNDDVPSWTTYDHSATITESIIQYTTDASSAFFTSGSGAVGAWVMTASFIYYIDDIFAATPTITLQHTFTISATQKSFDGDFIFNPGTHVAGAYYTGSNGRVIYFYTTNGTAWTEVDVNTDLNLAGAAPPWVFYSTSSASTVWLWLPFNDPPTGSTADGLGLAKSTDGGASYSFIDPTFATLTVGASSVRSFYIPFRGNGGDNNMYLKTPGNDGITRVDVSGGTVTGYPVTDSTGTWNIINGKFTMQCAYSRNKVFFSMTSGTLASLWVAANPGGIPSPAPVVGTSQIMSGYTGLDCSPEGDKLVTWSSDIYYWTEETGVLENKGTMSAPIIYAFVK